MSALLSALSRLFMLWAIALLLIALHICSCPSGINKDPVIEFIAASAFACLAGWSATLANIKG